MKYEITLVVVEAPVATDDLEAIANIVYESGRDDAFLYMKKGKVFVCLEQDDNNDFGLHAAVDATIALKEIGVSVELVNISEIN